MTESKQVIYDTLEGSILAKGLKKRDSSSTWMTVNIALLALEGTNIGKRRTQRAAWDDTTYIFTARSEVRGGSLYPPLM